MLVLLSACAPEPKPGRPDDTSSSPPAYTVDPATVAAIEAAATAGLAQADATGCSVAVWRDGAIVYTGAFGTRDEARDPVTTDTAFQIGSDTKKLTAMALLRLVDSGDVSLEDPVGALLPDLTLAHDPEQFATLTLRDLLSHQSGLYDYTPWLEQPEDRALAEVAYGRFADHEYAMMPGGIAYNYANPDYSLAGLILETVAGGSWADRVIDDVARPLGLDHTWARRDDLLAAEDDVASGFGPIPDGDLDSFDVLDTLFDVGGTPGWTLPEDQLEDAFVRPAGLVWSTAADQARLQMFLVNGAPDVLSDPSRAELQAGQVGLYPNLDPDDYGYGFGVMRIRGFTDPDGGFRDVPMRVHGGNTLDMTSTFEMLPDQRVGVSILSNGDGDDLEAVAVAALAGVAADRLPAPTDPIQPFAAPKADFAEYAGTFDDAALGEVDLTLVHGAVHVEIPYLDQIGYPYGHRLTPYALDLFLLELNGSPDFDLSFYPGPDGTPAAFAVNRAFVFQRVPDGAHARRPSLGSRDEVDRWVTARRDVSPRCPPGTRRCT